MVPNKPGIAIAAKIKPNRTARLAATCCDQRGSAGARIAIANRAAALGNRNQPERPKPVILSKMNSVRIDALSVIPHASTNAIRIAAAAAAATTVATSRFIGQLRTRVGCRGVRTTVASARMALLRVASSQDGAATRSEPETVTAHHRRERPQSCWREHYPG